jgi:SAM-dependent methyltransferase
MRNWNSDVPVELPIALEKSLFRKLKPETKNLQNIAWLNDFRAAISRGYIPNYQHDWVAFNYLFFAANFFKAKTAFQNLVCEQSPTKHQFRILDLGCGAGAASAGVLAGILYSNNKAQMQVEFTGVDRDTMQTSLYHEIFGVWALKNPTVTIRTICDEAIDFLNSNPRACDLILCSYMLSEETPSRQNEFKKKFEQITQNTHTKILFIDYETGSLDATAICFPAKTQLHFHEMSVTFPLMHSLCPEVCPKYCAHQHTVCTPPIPEPLASYFECWRRQDAIGIRKVFNSDARYEINAGRRLCGIQEIQDYWKQNAVEQHNVECVIHNCVANEGTQAAHWTARFFRADCGEMYSVHGMIWLEVEKGHIKRLIEFYSKNVFQIRNERSHWRGTRCFQHKNNNYLN